MKLIFGCLYLLLLITVAFFGVMLGLMVFEAAVNAL